MSSIPHKNSKAWTQKYRPKIFDALFSNEQVVNKLKFMVNHPLHSHFILRGPNGSGKKTMLNIYLTYVDPEGKNTLWLNCTNTKNNDIKSSLYHFIDKKTDCRITESSNKSQKTFKFIIIKNLERFPSQFYHILYNLLSNPNIIVIILETRETLDLATWCLVFPVHSRTTNDLISIGRYVCEEEKNNIPDDDIKNIALRSKLEVYTFIHILQCHVLKIKKFVEYTRHNLQFDYILNDPSLKNRLITIKKIELQGYSLEDIAISLYTFVYEEDSLNIPYLIELGSAIEKYSTCESQHDYIIYSISKMWGDKYLAR